MNAIEVSNLSKHYGSFHAVDDITFNVRKGEIFGFLGPNGAGKSTTIKMLCALLESTSGSANVAGFDINKEPEKVKREIGYMSQKFSLYDDLTVQENLNFYGGIYGLDKSEIANRASWAIEMAGLKGREKSLTRELSGGWKQCLALGCAVLHKPEIVFLDEPTGGVDPVSRRNFWELINQFSQQNITVFVTTHFLDEAEYCNNINLIYAGKIVAEGSPTLMKKKYIKNPIIEVECENSIIALELFQKKEWVKETSLFGTNIHIQVEDEAAGKAAIKETLQNSGIKLHRAEKIVPTLEDVFIHLIENTNPEGKNV